MGAGEPKVRTREDPDVRREQLLAAARRIVTERGVRSTTMAAVATEAGVAKGTTYLYFDSRDDLIAGLRSLYLNEFAAALRVPAAPNHASAAPGRRLDAFVEGLFRFAGEHHALHHALFHEAGFSEADAMAGARELLEQVLADGCADGTFTIDVSEVVPAAAFILHGTHGTLIDALHGPGGQHAVGPAVASARRAAGSLPEQR